MFLLIVIEFISYYICGNFNKKLIKDDIKLVYTNIYIDSNINNKYKQCQILITQLVIIILQILNNIDNPLYNISGNTKGYTGVKLKDAFIPSINNYKCSNEIDFNKNNVKNIVLKIIYQMCKMLIKNGWYWILHMQDMKLDEGTVINSDRYVIRINTISQSLKTASYNIRGTLPNSKCSISPWNNSIIEPDYNIKSLA